jgi:hypothetical protein
MCPYAPVELFAKIPETPRSRRIALTAVSARQALYMGAAIPNYDDNYAILEIGWPPEPRLIQPLF